jgi:hypothetical protein
MDNIIVYVDDATYALQMLQPMLPAGGPRNPTRWIVVGCAPRVTHRVSKWVTHSATGKLARQVGGKVFAQLMPVLQREGDAVLTQLAQTTLHHADRDPDQAARRRARAGCAPAEVRPGHAARDGLAGPGKPRRAGLRHRAGERRPARSHRLIGLAASRQCAFRGAFFFGRPGGILRP